MSWEKISTGSVSAWELFGKGEWRLLVSLHVTAMVKLWNKKVAYESTELLPISVPWDERISAAKTWADTLIAMR